MSDPSSLAAGTSSTKKSLTAASAVSIPLLSSDDPSPSVPKFWNGIPGPERRLLVVGASALGIGLVVGGTTVYLYRKWSANVQRGQVEALSKSLSEVYGELRSLQQGMVQVQESLTWIKREPGSDGKRRRPRRLQFYDSDSDDPSAFFSADDEKVEPRRLRPILKKSIPNGGHHHVLGSPLENGDAAVISGGNFALGLVPESPLLTPSDEDDVYEDASQDMFETFDEAAKALLFEKEFQHGDSPHLPSDIPEKPTPFDAMDLVLDASVTDDQVKSALDLIKSKQSSFPDNGQYLWRLAKATFIYANQCLKNNHEARIAGMKEAKEYADMAKKLAPSNADVLKWCALTTGGLARYAETTQKINYGLATRELLQQALELRPNDASLHHILGRWNYEIAQLGWIERTAVKAIFGKYANVTLEDAKKCFLEAERLKPKMFKSNLYFIAKCLAHQNKKTEARKWLNEALEVERLCVEDEQCEKDIQELMEKL